MIRTYLYLALAAAIAGGAGWIGYKVGIGVSTKEVHDADKALLAAANQDALDARTELEAQATQYAHEKAQAAKAKELGDQLYKDLTDDTTKTTQQLAAARKQIEALRHAQKPVADFLDTPIPAPLRDQLCDERADQTCGRLH